MNHLPTKPLFFKGYSLVFGGVQLYCMFFGKLTATTSDHSNTQFRFFHCWDAIAPSNEVPWRLQVFLGEGHLVHNVIAWNIDILCEYIYVSSYTLPETNISSPENRWLEYHGVLLGDPAYFQGLLLLVLGSKYVYCPTHQLSLVVWDPLESSCHGF